MRPIRTHKRFSLHAGCPSSRRSTSSLGPESQRRSIQTKRNSRSPSYAKVFEPSWWSLFGPVDEKSGAGVWATDHKCSGTLQQFKVIQEFAASGHPWGQVFRSPVRRACSQSTEGEQNFVQFASRTRALRVEDTSRRQPAQHPLNSGILVQQQWHRACNNLNQKADILRLVQVCRVTRWSEILGVESYFVGWLTIIWHILGTTTFYRKYTSMRDDLEAKPKTVIWWTPHVNQLLTQA